MALSYTASEAALPPGTPGCNDGNKNGDQPSADPGSNPNAPDGGFMGVVEKQNDAYRVRDQAIVSQKMKKNSTSLGITCFDKAMALTSRLGALFSDGFPINAGAENNTIFGNGQSLYGNSSSSNPDDPMGVADKFGGGIAAIINGGNLGSGDGDGGILSEFMGGGTGGSSNTNFTGSLSDQMGYTISTALNDLLSTVSNAIGNIVGGINGVLSQIQNTIGQVQGLVSQVQNAFSTVDGYLNSTGGQYAQMFMNNALGGSSWLTELLNMFQTIEGYVGDVGSYVSQAASYVNTVSGLVNGTFQSYSQIAGNYIKDIQGAATSMAGLSAFNSSGIFNFPSGGFNFQSANFTSVGTDLFNALGVIPTHIDTTFTMNGLIAQVTGGGCNGMHDVWSGLKDAGTQWVLTAAGPELQGGVAGIFGWGPTTAKDLPFFSLDEMVGNTLGSAGQDFLDTVAGGNLSGSDEIIQAAQGLLSGALGGPNNGLTSWKKPTYAPAVGASVDEVICSMKNMPYPC